MGSTRANFVFVGSVALGLAVFAAVILIGNPGGLTWVRFSVATAAFFAVTPGCAWIAGRTFLT